MEHLAGEEELAVLRALERYDGSATVIMLARALGVSRQKVTRLAAGMKKSMWVRVSCSIPGQVTYEIAPEGRRELDSG
jgi:DNA-binding IclR family transcriptional regulator